MQAELQAGRARVQASGLGVEPETVVVFDIAGELGEFAAALQRVDGMAHLATDLTQEVAEGWITASGGEVSRTLYFAGLTERGGDELLRLWRRFRAGKAIPRPHGAWTRAFEALHAVRRFGRRDRLLLTGALERWEDDLRNGAEVVGAEVELWYRRDAGRRAEAVAEVASALAQLGGALLQEPVDDPDAELHVMLVELPASAVHSLRAHELVDDVADVDAVRSMRAVAQATGAVRSSVTTTAPPPVARPTGAPVVAVFDGVPMARHAWLDGMLVVDDPDQFGRSARVADRKHGTAVVSTVLWRDLDAPATPPARPVYVRPLLVPGADGEESSPAGRLFADLLHGAVARLFDGPAVAPDVAVINLSIGLRDRSFDGTAPSALARLLDALAWRYRVLFVVSAGNIPVDREAMPCAARELEGSGEQRHAILARHLLGTTALRRVLSPAESVNALTVGAMDADASTTELPRWSSAWSRLGPALYSRHGPGVRRAMKPDVVVAGGRHPVQADSAAGGSVLRPFEFRRPSGRGGIGVAVASPGLPSAPTLGRAYERGTTFAAARVSHLAGRVSDQLDALATREGRDLFADVPRAVWIKCLLAHGAGRRHLHDWAEPALTATETARRNTERRSALDRVVGFGEVDEERVLACTAHRATALAAGLLEGDQAHEHRFPLPDVLREQGVFTRSVTVTVAWLTPINPRHTHYRGAALTLLLVKADGMSLKEREVHPRRGDRGTVIHDVQHGRGVAKYTVGSSVALEIACRPDALQHIDEPIPYVVAVTLEVDQGLPVDIYSEIASRIAVRPAVTVRG